MLPLTSTPWQFRLPFNQIDQIVNGADESGRAVTTIWRNRTSLIRWRLGPDWTLQQILSLKSADRKVYRLTPPLTERSLKSTYLCQLRCWWETISYNLAMVGRVMLIVDVHVVDTGKTVTKATEGWSTKLHKSPVWVPDVFALAFDPILVRWGLESFSLCQPFLSSTSKGKQFGIKLNSHTSTPKLI